MLHLHTTASHGPTYFLKVLESAAWALSPQGDLNRVEVFFHPIEETNRPWIAGDRDRYWRDRRWRWALRQKVRSLGRKMRWGRGEGPAPASDSGASLFVRLMERGERVEVATAHGSIGLQRPPGGLLGSPKDTLGTLSRARQLWNRLQRREGLDEEALLHLVYRDIFIGDLLTSQALRFQPEAAGDLGRVDELPAFLFRALAIVDRLERGWFPLRLPAAAMAPEPTYLHSLYKRWFHARGAFVLELHDYEEVFRWVGPTEPLRKPYIVERNRHGRPSPEDLAWARSYLEERIDCPSRHLAYLGEGPTREGEVLRGEDGAVVTVGKTEFSAIVFLHSFTDAQYKYGLDGFSDLYAWTITTVDHLVANSRVDRIFLKPHPSANYQRYPGDRIARDRLRERYAGEARLQWLDPQCGLRPLARTGQWVALTHHGKIAEELPLLGVPVLGTVHAPWGTAYGFVRSWQSTADYLRQLQGLSPETCSPATPEEQRELLDFVAQYRRHEPPNPVRKTWIGWAAFVDGSAPPDTPETFAAWTDAIGQIRATDPRLPAFLASRQG